MSPLQEEIMEELYKSQTKKLALNLLAMNALLNALPRPTPLGPRQKVARWFRIRWNRVVLAWRVLRGDDIHEDCC